MYYGEDNYNDYNDYDPDTMPVLKRCGISFTRQSYFDAGQFAVAVGAYDILLDLTLVRLTKHWGFPAPLEIPLPQSERQVVSRYFAALQASDYRMFFDEALRSWRS